MTLNIAECHSNSFLKVQALEGWLFKGGALLEFRNLLGALI